MKVNKPYLAGISKVLVESAHWPENRRVKPTLPQGPVLPEPGH